MSGRMEAIEPAASAAGTKALATTLTGAGALGWGGYTANDIAMFIGAVVAVVGLFLQWHYQRKRDKREQAEHQMRRLEHEARMAERGFYE